MSNSSFAITAACVLMLLHLQWLLLLSLNMFPASHADPPAVDIHYVDSV